MATTTKRSAPLVVPERGWFTWRELRELTTIQLAELRRKYPEIYDVSLRHVADGDA